ncbi:NUDIX domain-containing protein [Serratia rubidaea]|nr:NUDIX domain-containing protein [Serratia rubidaea]QPT11411.1 NUDIX domain-containing protein [Serratia rubidaea]
MRSRPAARLLVINPSGCILLFKFTHGNDALAGRTYWATPGGGVEYGESFEQAAIRELWEETGIVSDKIGASVAQRNFVMTLPSGETVKAEERFFVVRVANHQINGDNWSHDEKQVISEHHWWSEEELKTTREVVYPQNMVELLLSIRGKSESAG